MNATQGPVITTDSELDPKFQNLWKKAMLSAEQRNWDYVVSLVLPIVKEVPTFMDGRMILRRAEGERAKNAPKKLFNFGGSGVKLNTKKDPMDQIAELEEGVFQNDPYNPTANQTLYDLAMRAHFTELAAFALETIRQGHPTNTKNMHEALHASRAPQKRPVILTAPS